MKKLLLILLFLSPVFCEAQTSVYHPFPDSNAVWNIRDDIAVDQLGNYDNRYYSYTIIGDTIIGTYNYHILHVPFVQTYAPYNNSWSYQSGHRAGYLRQDTTLKKVFFIDYGDNLEYTLYDFNLNVGDTLPSNRVTYACFYPPIYYPTVASIDSILISGSYRKRWNTNVPGTKYFIEGIGSTDGLLETICSPEDPWEFATLLCFSQNGVTQYPDSSSPCEVLTKNQTQIFTVALTISPNPAHDKLNVECNLPNAELKIYDMMGREVMKEQLRLQFSTFNFQLPAGMYVARVSGGKKTMVQKLIIE